MSDVVKFLREHAGVVAGKLRLRRLDLQLRRLVRHPNRQRLRAERAGSRSGSWASGIHGARPLRGAIPRRPASARRCRTRSIRERSRVGRSGSGPPHLPRAWVAHQVTRRAGSRGSLPGSSRAERRSAKPCDSGQARRLSRLAQDSGAVGIERYRNQEVALAAELPCAGVLVLSDNWYPGLECHPGRAPGSAAVGLRGGAGGGGAGRQTPGGNALSRPASIRWGGVLSLTTFLSVAAYCPDPPEADCGQRVC